MSARLALAAGAAIIVAAVYKFSRQHLAIASTLRHGRDAIDATCAVAKFDLHKGRGRRGHRRVHQVQIGDAARQGHPRRRTTLLD